MILEAIINDYCFTHEHIKLHFKGEPIEVSDEIGQAIMSTAKAVVMLKVISKSQYKAIANDVLIESKPDQEMIDEDVLIEEVSKAVDSESVIDSPVIDISEYSIEELRPLYEQLSGQRADARWNRTTLRLRINALQDTI